MKKSQYNYIKKNNDTIIMFNTLKGSVVELNKDEYELYEKLEIGTLNEEMLLCWKKLGLIVEDDFDELQFLQYCRNQQIHDNSRASYRILTTQACNARCFYCYEGQEKKNEFMSEAVALDVAKFIESNSAQNKKIVLTWFGGEPLLNYKIISIIMNYLKKQLSSNVALESKIITNGILFNKTIIDEALNWNLSNIQITLDGMKQEHEKRKDYYNIKESFNKTIENVINLLQHGFRVSIRLNVDSKNVESIKELIEYIALRIGHPHNFKLYYSFLFGVENDSAVNRNKLIKEINEVMILNGYDSFIKKYRPRLIAENCYAIKANSFLISPLGKLFKCSQCINKGCNPIGDIYGGVRCMDGSYFNWCCGEFQDECKKCIFLPLCMGGCSATYLIKATTNRCYVDEDKINDYLDEIINKGGEIL